MNIEKVRGFIQPAIERGGNYTTFGQLAYEVASGEKQLWAVEGGAAITYLREYPGGLKALHVEYAGGDLGEILGKQGELMEFARREGATKLMMTGRKGWTRRLPEWRVTGVVMEREIQ